MLIATGPGKPDIVAGDRLAKPIMPHRHRLTLDLAQHDAVGPEMLDALYPRRMTVLRHDPDMLRANPDQLFAARDQVHRRRADEARRERGCRPAVKLLRRTILLDASVAHQHDAIGHRHRLGLVMRYI